MSITTTKINQQRQKKQTTSYRIEYFDSVSGAFQKPKKVYLKSFLLEERRYIGQTGAEIILSYKHNVDVANFFKKTQIRVYRVKQDKKKLLFEGFVRKINATGVDKKFLKNAFGLHEIKLYCEDNTLLLKETKYNLGLITDAYQKKYGKGFCHGESSVDFRFLMETALKDLPFASRINIDFKTFNIPSTNIYTLHDLLEFYKNNYHVWWWMEGKILHIGFGKHTIDPYFYFDKDDPELIAFHEQEGTTDLDQEVRLAQSKAGKNRPLLDIDNVSDVCSADHKIDVYPFFQSSDSWYLELSDPKTTLNQKTSTTPLKIFYLSSRDTVKTLFEMINRQQNDQSFLRVENPQRRNTYAFGSYYAVKSEKSPQHNGVYLVVGRYSYIVPGKQLQYDETLLLQKVKYTKPNIYTEYKCKEYSTAENIAKYDKNYIGKYHGEYRLLEDTDKEGNCQYEFWDAGKDFRTADPSKGKWVKLNYKSDIAIRNFIIKYYMLKPMENESVYRTIPKVRTLIQQKYTDPALLYAIWTGEGAVTAFNPEKANKPFSIDYQQNDNVADVQYSIGKGSLSITEGPAYLSSGTLFGLDGMWTLRKQMQAEGLIAKDFQKKYGLEKELEPGSNEIENLHYDLDNGFFTDGVDPFSGKYERVSNNKYILDTFGETPDEVEEGEEVEMVDYIRGYNYPNFKTSLIATDIFIEYCKRTILSWKDELHLAPPTEDEIVFWTYMHFNNWMAYGSKYEMEHRKMSYNITKWDYEGQLDFWYSKALTGKSYNPGDKYDKDPLVQIKKAVSELLALVRLATYRYYQIRFLGIHNDKNYVKE